ncbi:MAG: hypothetical protein ACREFR_08635 [Limisphaerales bacterium]
MVGANLPDNDAWTTALLSNPEVLAVDQDSSGQQARQHGFTSSASGIWTKKLRDWTLVAGFFNRTEHPLEIDYPWHLPGFTHAR